MKQALCITTLLFGTLLATDEPFIITNQPVNHEQVESLTTTDGEFETLFEIVDIEETPSLAQNELVPPLKISEEPLPLVENTELTPSPIASKTESPQEADDSLSLADLQSALFKEALPTIKINFNQVFSGSPIIYSLLLSLSVLALFIVLYNLIYLRSLATVSEQINKALRNRLTSNQYEEALDLCLQNDTLFCKMLAAGISVRKHGFQIMMDTMKAEGKRSTVKFWQKLALLNDIAIIAPMLGLLGTVLGMFYAFYDVNRSLTSLSALFDGLGISVGTTLAGLVVAILALMLHSIARYRLVKRLNFIENEAQAFVALIDNKI